MRKGRVGRGFRSRLGRDKKGPNGIGDTLRRETTACSDEPRVGQAPSRAFLTPKTKPAPPPGVEGAPMTMTS
eukprot:scaffold844_cov254-Pinguiococcus_pyrenoidosus.AAC.10